MGGGKKEVREKEERGKERKTARSSSATARMQLNALLFLSHSFFVYMHFQDSRRFVIPRAITSLRVLSLFISSGFCFICILPIHYLSEHRRILRFDVRKYFERAKESQSAPRKFRLHLGYVYLLREIRVAESCDGNPCICTTST